MQSVSHRIVGRVFGGFAVFALLLSSLSVVAPSSAKAGPELTALLLGLGLTAAAVVTVTAIENGDDEEGQSP